VVVEDLGEPFDFSKFGQMQLDHPDSHRYMQVGYDEGLLSARVADSAPNALRARYGDSSLRGVFAPFTLVTRAVAVIPGYKSYDPGRGLKTYTAGKRLHRDIW
jgi:hypothetical protein